MGGQGKQNWIVKLECRSSQKMNFIITIVLSLTIGIYNDIIAQPVKHFNSSIIVSSKINNISFASLAVNYLIQKKHHAFYIGPNFPVSNINGEGIGINAGYLFFPNSAPQHIDLFFHYDLQLNKETGVHLQGANLVPGKGIAIYNSLGYGFNINLPKQLYIVHNLGLGLKSFWIKNGHGTYELVGGIKLGMGYKF